MMMLWELSPALLGQANQPLIRVESHVVVVPTVVVQKADFPMQGELLGLPADEFQLFQDNTKQEIQAVAMDLLNFDVHDSLGCHVNYAGAGGGRWSSADWRFSATRGMQSCTGSAYRYLITYQPPPAPEGSCHEIRVAVDRPDTEVYSRSRYCYASGGLFDVLAGTEYGQELKRELDAKKVGRIKLAASAFVFRSDRNARVYVRIDFPWRSIACAAFDVSPITKSDRSHVSMAEPYFAIGIAGTFYQIDGAHIQRFSDFADWDGVSDPAVRPWFTRRGRKVPWGCTVSNAVPTRYETQVALPPGRYDFRVALTDGSKFGRVQVPLNIAPYDHEELAISGPVLVRRFRKAPVDGIHTKLAVKFVPLVSKGIEVTPTADTRFEKGDSLVTYFEIYEPLLSVQPQTAVQAHLRILDAKKRTIIKDFDAVDGLLGHPLRCRLLYTLLIDLAHNTRQWCRLVRAVRAGECGHQLLQSFETDESHIGGTQEMVH